MGQETIEGLHRWSIIFGVVGSCGFLLLVVLFIRFQYGRRCLKWLKKRLFKGRKDILKVRALLLASVLLVPSIFGLAAQAETLLLEREPEEESSLGETDGRVFVAVEGDSVSPDVYRDTAVAEITFQEKNFDEKGISLTVGDETGRETRITFESDGWKGLAGLGEGILEIVPYEKASEVSENQGEKNKCWFLDSEEGASEHTKERTVKMRLRFPAEGRFEIREASCRDLAGNVSGLAAPVSVIIDRTPPKLQIALPKEDLVHEGYYSHPVTVWLYLREHNFRPETAEGLPKIFLETQKGETAGTGRNPAGMVTEQAWEQAAEKGEDWYKLPIRITEDGNYRIEVSYEDPAGWPLSPESVTGQRFTVDTTAPEFGTITAMGESWNRFWEHVTFGRYSSGEEVVILEGGDSVSPVEPLCYFCAAGELTEHELEGLAKENWKEGNRLVLVPDSRTVVYLKVTNYAGLSSYFNSSGLVVENKGPVITLSPSGEVWTGSGIYRGDVELMVSLEEPEETGVFSGLRQASYMLEAEKDGKRELLEQELLLEQPGTVKQQEGGLKNWKDSVFLSAEEYDGTVLWFTVSAEDMAGNQSEESLRLSIDRTAPGLQVIYGSEKPENGHYYSQEREVQLIIEEANFSEEQVWIAVTNTDRVLPEISPWSHEGNIHSCRIVFSEDGDYTFLVRCEDLAGHTSEIREKDFTIDRTPPRIWAEFSEEGRAGSSSYYNAARTARITVEEHNFSPEHADSQIEALLDTGESRSWKVEKFESLGDVHTASLTFPEDGDYRLLFTCSDLAGNKDRDDVEEAFSIDRTPPELEILGLEKESANRGDVGAEIRFTDKRLVPERVAVEVFRVDQGGGEAACQYQEIQETDGTMGMRLLPESFPKTEETDGLYLLRAEGTDRAGNRTERELTFSVNRYGSVYAAAKETADWLGTGEYPYLSQEREVVIWEYNADPVEDFQVSLGRNGVVFRLLEGKNFQRKALSLGAASGGWQVYEYRIKKEVFEQEGDYEILLYSVDKAGNRMGNESTRNKERKKIFAFSVDKTGPSAILSGAKDRGRYQANVLEVFLDVHDNMRLQKVEVRTKDEKNCYEGESLERIFSEEGLKVKLSEADDWQTLAIYAEDAAGNRLELGNGRGTGASGCLEWEFLITSDWWIQLCSSPLRLLLFLIPPAGCLAGAAIIMARRRRKKKRKEEAPDHGQTNSFMVE